MNKYKRTTRALSESSINAKSSANLRKSRKIIRNITRSSRRKRSRLRYYRKLKQNRNSRSTIGLCEAITVFDFTDMEWSPTINTPSIEVAEWHKQEQIAYWKSRALSLEYENRMLIQHLRNVYAKQTEDYENYRRESIEDNVIEDSGVRKDNDDNDNVNKRVEAVEPSGKKRREEMEKLYGKMAPRIMGMETAVQLNYDLHLDEGNKIQLWPHTPLNLKFN